MSKKNKKTDKIYNATRQTPCDQCTHNCICCKTYEYRKFVEDIVAANEDMPEFLEVIIRCKHYKLEW